MNNLMKITAFAGVAILSGCVGSLDVPEGGLGSIGNTSNTIISNSGGNSIINVGGTVIGNIGGGGENVNRENATTLITPRAGFTQLESLLAQADNSENIVSSLNFNDDGITSRVPQRVSITGGKNQFIGNIAGERYIFSDSSDDENIISTASGSEALIRLQHYATGALDPYTPNDYTLFSYFLTDDAGEVDTMGFFVVGIETPPNTIPTTASATYSGRTLAFIASFSQGSEDSTFVDAIGGNVTMNVNFGRRIISGEISNINATSIGGDKNNPNIPANAIIELNETVFAGDGSYNGDLTVYKSFADPLNINTYVGSYSGDTYGPNASSLAGVFEFRGQTLNGQPYAATGGFYADK